MGIHFRTHFGDLESCTGVVISDVVFVVFKHTRLLDPYYIKVNKAVLSGTWREAIEGILQCLQYFKKALTAYMDLLIIILMKKVLLYVSLSAATTNEMDILHQGVCICMQMYFCM